MRFPLIRSTAIAAILVGAGDASAQIVQAPGAPINGICVYSESALLGQSAAGVAANRQLAQLQQSVNAQIVAMRDKIVADSRALAAQKGQLSAAAYNQQTADLQRRANDLQSLTQTRNNQLNRTRDQGIAQISTAALPLFNAAVAEHHCAIVLDKTPVYTVNPAMDLTGEIISRLNTKLPSISLQLAAPQAPPAS